MSRREQIIAKAMAMPKMPMAVQQVLKLFQDQEVDLGALIKTIEFDPGLTINILSVANSPYFGGLSNITTVRDAVVRLGARKIFQMVIAVGVVPYTKSEVKGYGLGSGELLRHSIAVALASQLLAKELGVEPPPHTFTSGLLVNIGKVAMDSFLEVDAEPILEKAHQELIPFEEAEEAVLGIHHAELGALLLEHWGLPEPIVTVVRWRLDPESYPGVDLALDLVHIGDMIAKMIGVGLGIDGLHYRPSVVVAQRLGLTQEVMEEVMARVPELVYEMEDVFLHAAQ